MMAATHRIAAGAVAAAFTASLAGCATGTGGSHGAKEGVEGPPAKAPKSTVRLIGDGSTAYTGAQPHQPRPERLKPGQKPPQFVVFSWDAPARTARSCSPTSARSPRPTTPP